MTKVKDGFYKQVDTKIGDDKYVLLGAGGHKQWSESASNSTLVARNSSGYVYANWFNTTSGDMGTTAFSRIYVSNDAFIRYVTLANFGAKLRDSGSLDGRYVLKSGDWMDWNAQLSFKGYNGSTSVFARLGYATTASGQTMHCVNTGGNQANGAFYITSNGSTSANDTGGLAIDNEGVTVFGGGDAGSNFTGVFRVLNEDNVPDGPQFLVTKNAGASVKYNFTVGGNLVPATTHYSQIGTGSLYWKNAFIMGYGGQIYPSNLYFNHMWNPASGATQTNWESNFSSVGIRGLGKLYYDARLGNKIAGMPLAAITVNVTNDGGSTWEDVTTNTSTAVNNNTTDRIMGNFYTAVTITPGKITENTTNSGIDGTHLASLTGKDGVEVILDFTVENRTGYIDVINMHQRSYLTACTFSIDYMATGTDTWTNIYSRTLSNTQSVDENRTIYLGQGLYMNGVSTSTSNTDNHIRIKKLKFKYISTSFGSGDAIKYAPLIGNFAVWGRDSVGIGSNETYKYTTGLSRALAQRDIPYFVSINTRRHGTSSTIDKTNDLYMGTVTIPANVYLSDDYGYTKPNVDKRIFLTIGNNANISGNNNHCSGSILLYSTNQYYTEIRSQGNGNRIFYLPNYADYMYAVHTANNSAVGSSTNPVYIAANGRATAISYSLSATVNAGTANRIAWYSAANTISSGSITTDGGYLGSVSYLSINTAHQTNYRLYVNGNEYVNGKIETIGPLRITSTSNAKYILIGNQDSSGANKPAIIESANAALYFGTGTSWSSDTGGTLTTTMFLSGSNLVGICQTSPTEKLHVSGGNILQEAQNSWLNPARLQLGRPNTSTYNDRSVIGTTSGNLHIDPYYNATAGTYSLYLNYYSSAAHTYFNGGTYKITNGGQTYFAGYHHTAHDNNDAVLLAGGSWAYRNDHTHPDQHITWGNSTSSEMSVIDQLFNNFYRSNRFAGVAASAITIEYSTNNGSSWTDYGLNDEQKRRLFINRTQQIKIGQNTIAADKSKFLVRVTIKSTSIYTILQKFQIDISTNYSNGSYVTIKAALNSNITNFATTICENRSISGWSGGNEISIPSAPGLSGGLTFGNNNSNHYGAIQFTFGNTGLSDTSKTNCGLTIYHIAAYGGYGWNSCSELASSDHLYSIDGNLRASFPEYVYALGFIKSGSSNSYVLLGGGEHKALSDFSMAAHSHPYLPLAGGTMNSNAQIVVGTINNSSGQIYSGGIQLREYQYQSTSVTDNYENAPGITFHWGGRWAHKLNMHTNDIYWDNNKIWHAGNDGSGTGLDADLLDGVHASGLFTDFSNYHSSTTHQLSITIGGTTKKATPEFLAPYSTLTYGNSGLQYFNINGTAGTTANANVTPTSDYYHILRMNHGNSAGYFADIAVPLNDVAGMYWRQVRRGTNYGWYKLLDTNNISPSLPISGNKIAVKVGGVTSDYITVPYATNADLLDGYHALGVDSTSKYLIKQAFINPGADADNDHWYRIATIKHVGSGDYKVLLYISIIYPIKQSALVEISYRTNSSVEIHTVNGYFGTIPAANIRLYYDTTNYTTVPAELCIFIAKSPSSNRTVSTRVIAEVQRGVQFPNIVELDNNVLIEASLSSYTAMTYANFLGNASTATSAAYLRDKTNGTATYSNYGAAGLGWGSISWLTCWNGYELRAISKAEMANTTIVNQNISSNADYPLVWSNKQTTTNDQGNQLYKSYDYLLYNPSTKVLRNDGPLWLRPDRDATLKIYSGKITDGYSDGFICMQTSIDGTDGQSHSHPTNYGARCVIALQPRGGEVYIGKTITAASTSADATYKLNVDSKAIIQASTLDNTAFRNTLTIFGNNSNESSGNAFTEANASWGIGFQRQWQTGTITGICAGIFAVPTASWRSGLAFRVKNNTTASGGTHDVTAVYISPAGSLLQQNNNSWLTPARTQIGRLDGTTYTDRAVIGATNGNLHIDPYSGSDLYLNYYANANSDIFMVTNGGKVGINRTDPVEKLDVNGNIRVNGNIYPQTTRARYLGTSSYFWNGAYIFGEGLIHPALLRGNGSYGANYNINTDNAGWFKLFGYDHNHLGNGFYGMPGEAITVEYTTNNGSSWAVNSNISLAQKYAFTNNWCYMPVGNVTAGYDAGDGNTAPRAVGHGVRITLDFEKDARGGWFDCITLYLRSRGCTGPIKIEGYNANNDAWYEIGSTSMINTSDYYVQIYINGGRCMYYDYRTSSSAYINRLRVSLILDAVNLNTANNYKRYQPCIAYIWCKLSSGFGYRYGHTDTTHGIYMSRHVWSMATKNSPIYAFADTNSNNIGAARIPGTLYVGDDLRCTPANTEKWSTIIIGNGNAINVANNHSRGRIQIYSDYGGYNYILSGTSNTSGFTNYIGKATGWLAVGGNGTSTGVGSATNPIYLNTNGVLTGCSYSLGSTVNAGVANRMAWYNGANSITYANNIWTNGTKLGINTTSEPSYNFYVSGTGYHTGTLYVAGQPAIQTAAGTGNWNYIRMHNGSNFWDIATKSNSNSGTLDFRPDGADNIGPRFETNGRAQFATVSNTDANYSGSSMWIREYRYGGSQTDAWAYAPRLGWHWSGRVAAQIGLASNGWLYEAPLTATNFYRIVVEGSTGVTWGINISGNAGTATKWQTARTLTIGNTGKSVDGSANVSWSLAEIIGSTAVGSVAVPIYWTGSSFASVQATFGNSSTGEHNANNIKSNGMWYYNSNGPATSIGASTGDGALYSQAYSTSWCAQIAQDYRNGNLFVRSLNNGTWKPWKAIATADNDYIINPESNIVYNASNKRFIKVAGGNTSWDSELKSKSSYKECKVTYRIGQTNAYIMFGLNSDPNTAASYNSIDYCWYTQGNGNLNIYENGTSIASIEGHTTYSAGDEFIIECSDDSVKYYHNGVLCRKVARNYGTPLYLDSSFYTLNGYIYDLVFEPIHNNAIYWKALVKCATFSRICYIKYDESTTGSSFILNFKATRNSVVYDDTYLINTHHSSKSKIVCLNHSDYGSNIEIQVDTNSGGDCYISLKDSANNATNSTTQSIKCAIYPIRIGAVLPYTVFTDGTTPVSGFTSNTFSPITNSTMASTGIMSKFYYYDSTKRTDNYVLLGGGGAIELGDLSSSHTHPYLPLAGGTMTPTALISWGNNDRTDWDSFGTGLRIQSSIAASTGAPTQYASCLNIGIRYSFQIAAQGGNNKNFFIRNSENKVWCTLLHSENSSVSGGGSTWGSSITVKINGESKTLTIPGNPNTWRNITVNGNTWKGTGTDTGVMNIKAGTNISLSTNGNDLTITGTDTNTDTKVTQNSTTDNSEFRLLLKNTANDTNETNIAKYNTNLRFNPNLGRLYATGAGNIVQLTSNSTTYKYACIIYKTQNSKSWSVGADENDRFYFYAGTNSKKIANLSNNGNLYLGDGDVAGSEKLDVNGNIRVNGNVYPQTTNARYLGTSSYYWQGAYINGGGNIHWNNLVKVSNTNIVTTDTNRGLPRILANPSTGMQQSGNRFYGLHPNSVTIEYTTNGSTWTTQTTSTFNTSLDTYKRYFTQGHWGSTSYPTRVGNVADAASGATCSIAVNMGTRITLDMRQENRTGWIECLSIYFLTRGHNCSFTVERQNTNSGTWTTIETGTLNNTNQYRTIYPQTSFYLQGAGTSTNASYANIVRITMIVTSLGTAQQYAPSVVGICGIGPSGVGQTRNATYTVGRRSDLTMAQWGFPLEISKPNNNVLAHGAYWQFYGAGGWIAKDTNNYAEVYIGNAANKNDANEHAEGILYIYSAATHYHAIRGTSTTSHYHHYLPNSTGWIATGGNGTYTGVGSSTKPVYLSSAGVLTECSEMAVSGHTHTWASITNKPAATGSAYKAIYWNGSTFVETNRMFNAVSDGTYWGMRNPDGDDTWIKTSTNGFLPYTSGGEWAGHSSLGTSSWYFANIYTQYLNDIHIRKIAVNNSTAWATNFDTEVFGVANNTNYKLSILRMNSSAPTYVIGNYATGIAWKGSDTKAVMSVAYSTPAIRWAGGSGTSDLTWWIEITGTSGTSYNLNELRDNVIVNQNNSSNANYPLIWSNQNNTSTVRSNQLYKSYSDLLYNPSTKTLSVIKISINKTSIPDNSGSFQVVGTSTMRTILAEATNTYDLGSTSLRWKSTYNVDEYIGTASGSQCHLNFDNTNKCLRFTFD